MGRYLGPARDSEAGGTENALEALGVVYALQAKKAGLGTATRFRNQGLAGFGRSGASLEQAQSGVGELTGAIGIQSPEDLFARFNDALSGGFSRKKDQFTRSEVLENVADNAGDPRSTRSDPVRLIDTVAGIIDIVSQFDETVDSSQLAAEVTATEIEQTLTSQGRALADYAGILEQVRAGSIQAAEALTEIGGIEFSDLTFSAAELGLELKAVAEQESAQQTRTAINAELDALREKIDLVKEQTAAGKSLAEIEAESAEQARRADLKSLFLSPAEIDEILEKTRELNQEYSRTVVLSQANADLGALEERVALLDAAVEAGKSLAEVEAEINEERTRAELTGLGLSPDEVEDIVSRTRDLTAEHERLTDRLREERDLQDEQAAAAERAAAAAEKAAAALRQAQETQLSGRLGQTQLLEQVGYLSSSQGASRNISALQDFGQQRFAGSGAATADDLQTALGLLDQIAQEEITLHRDRISAIQERYSIEISALREQVTYAQQFRGVVSSIDQIMASLTPLVGGELSPTHQIDYLQRRDTSLQNQLGSASVAERPALLQERANILRQIAEVGLEAFGSTDPRAAQLRESSLIALEEIRDESLASAASEEEREQQLLDKMDRLTASLERELQSQTDAAAARLEAIFADQDRVRELMIKIGRDEIVALGQIRSAINSINIGSARTPDRTRDRTPERTRDRTPERTRDRTPDRTREISAEEYRRRFLKLGKYADPVEESPPPRSQERTPDRTRQPPPSQLSPEEYRREFLGLAKPSLSSESRQVTLDINVSASGRALSDEEATEVVVRAVQPGSPGQQAIQEAINAD